MRDTLLGTRDQSKIPPGTMVLLLRVPPQSVVQPSWISGDRLRWEHTNQNRSASRVTNVNKFLRSQIHRWDSILMNLHLAILLFFRHQVLYSVWAQHRQRIETAWRVPASSALCTHDHRCRKNTVDVTAHKWCLPGHPATAALRGCSHFGGSTLLG